MGNSLDRIDQGLYICGLDALKDVDRLKKLGISHILNAASLELYNRPGDSLSQLPKLFTVKALECQDSEDCNLSVHFQDVADFVEEGRAKGGVVVHCAAGISRSTTAALAYMMIKEHLSLEAAFHKVHSVRKVVHPNDGFWRQLRDLEAVLRLRGVELQPLAADLLAGASEEELPGPAPADEDDDDAAAGLFLAGNAAAVAIGDFAGTLASMDAALVGMRPFATHFLTARLEPESGLACSQLADRLKNSEAPGVVWSELYPDGDLLCVRAKVVPYMDSSSFRALLEREAGVQAVVACE